MVKATTKKLAAAAMAAVCLGLASPAKAGAVDVSYVLQNLGGGLFQYDYTITNNSLGEALSDIVFDFDASLYQFSSLASGGTPTGWSDFVFFSAPGDPPGFEFFGGSLAEGSQQGGFAVQFRWIGAGSPATQSFKVYNAAFDVIASGRTTDAGTTPPGVPEPQSLALVMLALMTAAAAARRGASRPAG